MDKNQSNHLRIRNSIQALIEDSLVTVWNLQCSHSHSMRPLWVLLLLLVHSLVPLPKPPFSTKPHPPPQTQPFLLHPHQPHPNMSGPEEYLILHFPTPTNNKNNNNVIPEPNNNKNNNPRTWTVAST